MRLKEMKMKNFLNNVTNNAGYNFSEITLELFSSKYFNPDKGCLGFLLFSNIEWKRMSRKQGQS